MKRLEAKNPEVFKKVSRVYGAHSNGLEIFPLWTAAVVRASTSSRARTYK